MPCQRAGDPTWRLDRPLTWLGRTTQIAVLVLLASILLGAALLALTRPSLGPASLLQAAALAWWGLLGAPLHLVGEWTGTDLAAVFDAQVRLGVAPLGAVAALLLALGGGLSARALKAASERESLVAGALLALPSAVLCAAMAAAVAFRVEGLALSDTSTLTLLARVSPLHAAAAALAWGLPAAALGGLARYWLWSRGTPGGMDGLRVGAGPEAAGAVAGVLITALLAFAICAPRVPGVRPDAGAVTIDQRLVAYALAAGGWEALAVSPVDLAAGGGVVGRVRLLSPGEAEALDVETWTSWREARTGTGVAAALPEGVAAVRYVPWLAALLAGMVAARLRRTCPTLRSWLGLALLLTGGLAALAALSGAWVLARVEIPGLVPAPGLQLWAWWRASLLVLPVASFPPCAMGAAVGLLLARRR